MKHRIYTDHFLQPVRCAAVVLVIAILTGGCVSIPKEAPGLSAQLGNRINAIEASHMSLLSQFFDEKRDRVDEFLFNQWVPLFAKNFFEDPDIAESWDEIVRSNNTQDRLDFILVLGPILQEEINNKQRELVQPLNELEHTIERQLRGEYSQLKAMNNSITSFLTSASKVSESRTRYLEMFNVTDQKISNALNSIDGVVSNLVQFRTQGENVLNQLENLQKTDFDEKLKEIQSSILGTG